MNDKDHKVIKKITIGMRIVKTVISVYISIVLTNLIKGRPINSAIAAFICTRSNDRDSVNTGRDRVIGTIIGGVFSIIFILAIEYFNIKLFTNIYYIILALLLIPIIKTTLWLNVPDATSNAAIVAIITLLSYVQEENAYAFVVNRMIDTMIGVLVAIVINKLLPNRTEKEDEEIQE